MESLRKQAAKLLGEQKKYRRWLGVFLCLAVLVTAGTLAALTMNGQALNHKEKVLECSLEVHEHTAECYESGILPQAGAEAEEPICGYADYVIHVHNDDCLDKDGQLVCGIPERKPHVHQESCYTEEKILVCELEETPGHVHSEECKTLICGFEETESQTETTGHVHSEECKTLICGQEETSGHTHSDECRSRVRGDLICTSTEEGHEHSDECYTWTEELICGLEETEGHTHTEECYDPAGCGLAEGEAEGTQAEGHVHTEECYAYSACGLEEGAEGHTHTEECYEIQKVLICKELELHTHVTREEATAETESCYDKEGRLICGIPELKEHVHGEECFATVELSKEEVEAINKEQSSEEGDVSSGNAGEADGAANDETDGTAPEAGTEEGDSAESGAEGTETTAPEGGTNNIDASGNAGITEGSGEKADDVNEKVYQDEAVKVVAQYGDAANIPEEAELVAEPVAGMDEGNSVPEDSGTETEESAPDSAEDKREEVSYRIGFFLDGQEIKPEDTVTFTVWRLDEEGKEAGEPAVLVYRAEDSAEAVVSLAAENIIGEAPELIITKTYADDNVRITAEYQESANLPENAELFVQYLNKKNPAFAEEEGAEETVPEDTDKEIKLRVGFSAEGNEKMPEDTVTFTIQTLDKDGNDAGEVIVLVYHAGDGLDALMTTLTVISEEQLIFRKSAEDGDLRVIAEYGAAAEIPEEAELRVRRITAETDPEYYAKREAEYRAYAGEDAVMDFLLNIGFFIGEEELEPKAPVSITIQMLGNNYEDGEEFEVIHFGEETESMDASAIATNEEGNKFTSFETDSFSDYGGGTSGVSAASVTATGLTNGKEYIIYCEIDGTLYALSHRNNSLGSAAVTLEGDKIATFPEGYTRDDFYWTYENSRKFKYSAGGTTRYLYYNNSNGRGSWQLSSTSQTLSLSDVGDGSVRISSSSRYLNCSSGGAIQRGTSATSATAWTLTEPEAVYTINYWKNENSLNAFQLEVTDKGTLVGSIEKSAVDGQVRIPLRGTADNGAAIGTLEDCTGSYNNVLHTYKFYGWSLKSNANYQQNKDYMIYCGDKIEINGVRVPTYIESGEIVMNVSGLEGTSIDLYAIWAAPSQAEGENGVPYFGNNNKTYDGSTQYEKKGKGALFFVRLDGVIPNEPGMEGDSQIASANYTGIIYAKDDNGDIQRNPLKYWMHIYGSGSGNAVENNLRYRPKNIDILNALIAVNNAEGDKAIKVGGDFIDFRGMELTDFEADYYVYWYVCKDGTNPLNSNNVGTDCWHIDGVLLKKSKWTLIYADNNITGGTVIPGTQYDFQEKGGSAEIHNTYVNKTQVNTEPERTGYYFNNWNTELNGTGISFSAVAGDTITVNEGTKEVYKNGVATGVYAVENEINGGWEVTLYPQWTKGRNQLVIAKTNTEGKVLRGARFTLRECTLEYDEELQKNILKPGRTLPGNETETGEEGIMNIPNLENDTYYCLEESYAPDGYERRTKIYFSVNVSADKSKIMDINILNEEAGKISKPEWIATEYDKNGTSGTNGIANINFTIEDEAILQEVSFRKTDENGAPLKGAAFKLFKETEVEKEGGTEGETELRYVEIGTSTVSDDKGEFSFTNVSKLSYGKYMLEEITVPADYQKTVVYFEINDPDVNEVSYKDGLTVKKVTIGGQSISDFSSRFSVSATKETVEIVHGTDNIAASRYSYVLTVQNEPVKQFVRILKKETGSTEETVKYLDGAVFAVYDKNPDAPENKDIEPKAVWTSETVENQAGLIYDGNLKAGTYWLVETEAPDGYNLLSKAVTITIASDGVRADGANVLPKDNENRYIIEISNSAGYALPQTGGTGTLPYTIGGATLLTAAAILMYGYSMRRKKSERRSK